MNLKKEAFKAISLFDVEGEQGIFPSEEQVSGSVLFSESMERIAGAFPGGFVRG